MSARRLPVAALAAVALATVAIVGGSDDADYEAVVAMDDALGLRDGSKVVIGGVEVGRVNLDLGDGDQVLARLKLDEDHAPIGRGARATVTSVNLLGQKSLELDPGDLDRPVPSGAVIPGSRVTASTDLDQVLDVLDADTRARLTVLVGEAGAAFAGRRVDVSGLLRELPSSLTQGTKMLDRLVGDGRTLGDLVRRSDRFVATVTRERRELARLLDTVGRGSETVAARRAELRATLAALPGTLATARSFLDELRATTVPLGPAARNLSATAKPLEDTMARVSPFTKAATPALLEARDVAPALTRLADRATPVLRKATPPVRQLATFSKDLVPVTDMLDRSADNIVATVANWAHAIQFRDGLGHIFRAEVAVTPQSLDYFLDRLKPEPAARRKSGKRRRVRPRTPAIPKPSTPANPSPRPKRPGPVGDLTSPITDAIDEVVGGLTSGVLGRQSDTQSTEALLDMLLSP